MKKIIVILALAFFSSGIGVGYAIANHEPIKTYDGLLGAGEDSFGRQYSVSAFSAMIDEDDGVTVVLSEGHSLRFEESRLLIDGYVACELTPEMGAFDVKFSDEKIVVSVEGEVIVDRGREMSWPYGL